jgi:magnesium chelatase subunit H
MRLIFITMDGNHAGALRAAARLLAQDQGVQLTLGLYDATKLRDPADIERLTADIAGADLVFGSMLFGEEFVRPLEPVLRAAACRR